MHNYTDNDKNYEIIIRSLAAMFEGFVYRPSKRFQGGSLKCTREQVFPVIILALGPYWKDIGRVPFLGSLWTEPKARYINSPPPPQKKRTRPVSSQNGPNKRFSTNLRTAVKAAGEKLSHQCLFI